MIAARKIVTCALTASSNLGAARGAAGFCGKADTLAAVGAAINSKMGKADIIKQS